MIGITSKRKSKIVGGGDCRLSITDFESPSNWTNVKLYIYIYIFSMAKIKC